MISLPFRRSLRDQTIEAVYGMIVAQARSPEFYRSYGVPDTVEARFDMIVLHLVLVLRRLRTPEQGLSPLGQQIFDRFCLDMDHNFREMGVGDLSVPKQMRRVAEAYYGRAGAYDAALAAYDQTPLTDALARNVFGRAVAGPSVERLARYVRAAARQLDAQDLATDQLRFPAPEQMAG